jgi:hypothetical protein
MGRGQIVGRAPFFCRGGCYFDWKSLRSMEPAMAL